MTARSEKIRSEPLAPTISGPRSFVDRMVFTSTRQLFVAIVFGALFVMSTREIVDPDFWWHLRTGQYIVDTQSVPRTDIFSFTAQGEEWVAHEWLSEVLIYLFFRAGGMPLLIVAFAAVITAAFALAFLLSEGRPFVAGFVLMLGALASSPTWGVRPQMLSVLLASAFLYLLRQYHDSGRSRWLAPIVPLTLLWVNLHSGFAIGIVILGVHLLVGLFGWARNRNSNREMIIARGLIIVFALSVASVMLNPNGPRMYTYPFETLTSPAMQKYIQEWFSPDFHSLQFQPFALLLVFLIGIGLWARASISLTTIILVVSFGYASLRSARNIPFFALAAIPALSRQVSEGLYAHGWLRDRNQSVPTRSGFGMVNTALILVLLIVAVFRVYAIAGNQSTAERSTFPAGAVDYINAEHPPSNLYNSYGWGGYLAWRLYPNYRVYIDGRADVYGDSFIEDYLKIYRAEPDWSAQLDSRGVRLVLVEPNSPLALAIAGSSGWQRVYADDHSVLFRRN